MSKCVVSPFVSPKLFGFGSSNLATVGSPISNLEKDSGVVPFGLTTTFPVKPSILPGLTSIEAFSEIKFLRSLLYSSLNKVSIGTLLKFVSP